MANNHAICESARVMGTNTDPNIAVGIATTDMDNGTFVTLGTMNVDSNKNIKGYEYNVTAATATATKVWMVCTPMAGTDILEAQLLDDPRYFYNKAGKAMTLVHMNADVDLIRVDKAAFTNALDPDTVTSATVAGLDANGKLKALATAPTSGAYFTICGKELRAIGQELVPMWVLRCERN